MLKAVIFDMDGVIIDSEPIYYKVCNSILKDFNAEMTKEEYYSYIGKPAYEIWESLKKKYKLQRSVEELIEINREAYKKYLINSCEEKPIEGTKELILDLYRNNLRLAVASSSSTEIINIVLNKFDIRQHFSVIVSGDDIREGKTSPHIFLHTAEKLGVKPGECIVIEDSCDGAASAKKAGMKCIALRNLNSGKQKLDGSDMIIEGFKEASYAKLSKLCT